MFFLRCRDQLYVILKVWRHKDFLHWQNVIFGHALSTIPEMGNFSSRYTQSQC